MWLYQASGKVLDNFIFKAQLLYLLYSRVQRVHPTWLLILNVAW